MTASAPIPTKLNSTQLYILQMYSFAKSDATKSELQRLLKDFYVKKVELLAQQVWDNKGLTSEEFDNADFHFRTEYK